MVAASEIIICVSTGTDPCCLDRLDSLRIQTRVQTLAVNDLVLVSLVVVQVNQVHELLQWVVGEDEVSQLEVVSLHHLLNLEPLDGRRADA